MSEERIIRINKVLRELNISLERAVDYLKDKGIAIEANPNTKISNDVYNVLCGQFAGDRGKKEASKEVGEEKRKEKEALRVEREKEIEDKRKQDDEILRQQQEVIKARATVTGPVQVGKIDLNPKKASPSKATAEKATEAPKPAVPAETPAPKTPAQEKLVSDKKEIKPAVDVKDAKKEDKPEVAKAAPIPVILYNVPSRTGVNMLPKTTLEIAHSHPNVIGIKEAKGDMEQIAQLLARKPEGFLVVSGDDATAYQTTLAGGSGVISVVSQSTTT